MVKGGTWFFVGLVTEVGTPTTMGDQKQGKSLRHKGTKG